MEDLDYYGDDFSGDSALPDYQIGSNNSRAKRSSSDYDGIYSLLAMDAEKSLKASTPRPSPRYSPSSTPRPSSSPSYSSRPSRSPSTRSEVVTVSRGELTDLEPCTEYGLSVVTVFPDKTNVTSREEILRTPCSEDCPANTTGLALSTQTNMTTGRPDVWMEILTPPDCLSHSSFVLNICLEGEGQCESSEPFRNRKEKIDITNLSGLSQLQLQSCSNYSFTLSLATGQTLTKNWLHTGSDLTVKPPGKDVVSIETSSARIVRLDVSRASGCVRGYDVILYEIRHLPTVARQYRGSDDQHRVHQQTLSSEETALEIVVKPGGRFRAEVRNIYLDQTQSEPLELYVETPCEEAHTIPEVYTEKEVKVERVEGNNSVIIQFSSRCVSGYDLSVCPDHRLARHQQDCQTFSIPSSEEGRRRGFYQQEVSQLPPCSVLRWEVTSTGPQLSLYQNFLLTGTEPDQDNKPFSLSNAEVKTGDGGVLLSWDLSQPCVLQYNITVCPASQEEEQEEQEEKQKEQEEQEEEPCWSGSFARPDFESREDFKFEIDLTAVRAFHSLSLEQCGDYQVTVEAGAGAGVEGEVVLPFTFLRSPEPPATSTITKVRETSALVSWSVSACSNSGQVMILVSQEGREVEELQPQSGHTSHLVEGLRPCSHYFLQIFGVEAGLRSDLAQMVFLITRPHIPLPLALQTDQETLSLNIEADWSGCVEEVRLTACQATGENCQQEEEGEEEERSDEVSVPASLSQLVLGGRTANTQYKVSVVARYHDNSTQTLSQQCVRTQVLS